MASARLLHAGLLVSDVARAREFYEGVLSLAPKPRPDLGYDGAWYDLGACELHLMATRDTLPEADARAHRAIFMSPSRWPTWPQSAPASTAAASRIG